MWRLTEGGLLAMPLALLAIFLVMRSRGQEPTRRALLLGFAGIAALGCALAWFGTHADLMQPGTRYVPAELHNGEIVPGHGAEAPGTAAVRKLRDGDAAGTAAPGGAPSGG